MSRHQPRARQRAALRLIRSARAERRGKWHAAVWCVRSAGAGGRASRLVGGRESQAVGRSHDFLCCLRWVRIPTRPPPRPKTSISPLPIHSVSVQASALPWRVRSFVRYLASIDHAHHSAYLIEKDNAQRETHDASLVIAHPFPPPSQISLHTRSPMSHDIPPFLWRSPGRPRDTASARPQHRHTYRRRTNKSPVNSQLSTGQQRSPLL